MKKLNKKGFTLMELIVVIAIIAVLMLILVPTMGGFVSQAKEEANIANAKAIYTAIIAQNTAASSGLKPSDSATTKKDVYETVTQDGNGKACSDTNIHKDFYDNVSSLEDCTVTYKSDKYYVSYGKTDTGYYPSKP